MESNEDRLAGPQLRQAAVDALAEAFAGDAFSVEEYERRVELAHRAETEAELRVLLADLPRATPPAVRGGQNQGAPHTRNVPAPRTRAPLPAPRQEQSFIIGIMGGGERSGAWVPARYNYVFGVMGGAELDFRDAYLPPGEVTDIRCFAFMGGMEIIVPPDVIVDTSGVGIMGGFEHVAPEAEVTADSPVIRITGVAFMGGVGVSVRYPGESAKEARRRRKEEKKERKRLQRGGG